MNSSRSLAWALVALLLVLSVGCSSSKSVHERGWIGGQYQVARKPAPFSGSEAVPAFPRELDGQYRAGLLVGAVQTNSPVADAGLQAGDLILDADHRPVTDTDAFWKTVNRCPPAHSLAVRYYRDGEMHEGTIVVGRETFRRWNTVAVGLLWSPRLDLWPNPGFSLIAGGYQRDRERLELGTPSSQFVKAHQPAATGDKNQAAGLRGREGWRLWLLVFGFGGHTEVLSQEPAARDDAVAVTSRGTD